MLTIAFIVGSKNKMQKNSASCAKLFTFFASLLWLLLLVVKSSGTGQRVLTLLLNDSGHVFLNRNNVNPHSGVLGVEWPAAIGGHHW